MKLRLLLIFLATSFPLLGANAEKLDSNKKTVKREKTNKRVVVEALTEEEARKILTSSFYTSLPKSKAIEYMNLMQAYSVALEREFPFKSKKSAYLEQLLPLQVLFKKFFEEACAAGVQGGAPNPNNPFVCGGFIYSASLGEGAEAPSCVSRPVDLPKDQQLKLLGLDASGMNCKDSEILCNPLVYCYNVDDRKVFCASSSAKSVAQECAAQAHAKANIPDPAKTPYKSGLVNSSTRKGMPWDRSPRFTVDDFQYATSGKKMDHETADGIAQKQCDSTGGVAYRNSFWGTWGDWGTDQRTYSCKKSAYAEKCTSLVNNNLPALEKLQTSFKKNCLKSSSVYTSGSDEFKGECDQIGVSLVAFLRYTETDSQLPDGAGGEEQSGSK